jgi:hypothetical protein
VEVVSFAAHEERITITPWTEEAKMPNNEQKPRSELLNGMEAIETKSLDPTNCPTCRSGIVEYPVAIVADVVNVEL